MVAHALIVGILCGPGWLGAIPGALNDKDTRQAPAAQNAAVEDAGERQSDAAGISQVGTSGAPAAHSRNGHVRPLNVDGIDATAFLDAARLASPTVRRLMATLDDADVIVLVELRYRPGHQSGGLRFVSCAHGTRWLHVVVDRIGDTEKQIGWLAHELQHAVEIAQAPDVQDEAALVSLYERIGQAVGPFKFETAAACEAGRQAWLEALDARKRDRRQKESAGQIP